MTPEIAHWLKGQIEAVRVLADDVAATTLQHSAGAGAELANIRFACNTAANVIESEAPDE